MSSERERIMGATSKLLPRGQVTVPQAIRDQARLKPGDLLTFRVTADGTVEIKPVPRLSVDQLVERYPIAGPIDEVNDRDEWEAEAAKDAFSARDA